MASGFVENRLGPTDLLQGLKPIFLFVLCAGAEAPASYKKLRAEFEHFGERAREGSVVAHRYKETGADMSRRSAAKCCALSRWNDTKKSEARGAAARWRGGMWRRGARGWPLRGGLV